MLSTLRIPMLVLAVAASALLTAGCGSDDSSKSTSTPKASDEAKESTKSEESMPAMKADSTLAVEGGEMYFKPTSYTATAGNVKFVFKNVGAVEHELIVIKSDAAIDSLKPAADGRVSEDDSVGEVSETAAGATKSAVIKLEAGKYLIVCNIPGHYAAGMRATLVVS